MAYGLLSRIIEHGFQRGYWRENDLIGDCFGGIGTTGIMCSYRNLRSISVELEARFVGLAQENFDLHRKAWKTLGLPEPVLIQGDSRQFASIVGAVGGCVTSPPFVDCGVGGSNNVVNRNTQCVSHNRPADIAPGQQANGLTYGSTPGQIGRLPAGKLEAVITSPPYAESIKGDHFERETAQESRDARITAGGSLGQSQRNGGYGQSPGQIGRLPAGKLDSVITSPPYAESLNSAQHGIKDERRQKNPDDIQMASYGQSPGNIGNLRSGRLDACVTSPPWENQEAANAAHKHADPAEVACRRSEGYASGKLAGHYASPEAIKRSLEKADAQVYGESVGQIGNSTGETYWQAMRAVYEQVHLALKPGGVAAIVVKDYVSKGKRVPLCDDTLKLLVSLGFEPIERVHAMLTKTEKSPCLFGGELVKTTKRVSFFRRLAEKKGSPPIDWEEVLWVRKPVSNVEQNSGGMATP